MQLYEGIQTKTLNNIYVDLLKTDRDFTIEDYNTYFIEDQRAMDDEFEDNAIREIEEEKNVKS